MRAVASISNSVYHLVNKFCIVAVVFVGQGEILIIDQHLQTINHSLQNKKLCYILTLLNCSQLKYKTSVKRNDLYRTLLVFDNISVKLHNKPLKLTFACTVCTGEIVDFFFCADLAF